MMGAQLVTRKMCFSVVAIVHVFILISTASKSLPTQDDRIIRSPQAAMYSKQEYEVVKVGAKSTNEEEKEDEAYKELGRLGSRPPNCEHKCGGCVPCEAIQVPATSIATPTTSSLFRLQYTNYEPEGWKCQCGSSFDNP